jgi:hypothetical protein
LDKTLEGGSSAPLNTSLDDWHPVIVGANHFLVWCEILSKLIHKFFETPHSLIALCFVFTGPSLVFLNCCQFIVGAPAVQFAISIFANSSHVGKW